MLAREPVERARRIVGMASNPIRWLVGQSEVGWPVGTRQARSRSSGERGREGGGEEEKEEEEESSSIIDCNYFSPLNLLSKLERYNFVGPR